MPETQLTADAALLADPTRVALLNALMDGRAHTGGELARHVGVAPSTGSEHLSKLLDAGMVVVEPQGRHRYFRLAGEGIADLRETLGATAVGTIVPSPRAPSALRYARTCYKHLAGELGVRIFDQLQADGHIEPFEDKLTLTASGEMFMAELGVDMATVRKPQQATVRCCLDWTERRHHLAGRAANAMLLSMFERQWITCDNVARSIRVTEVGRGELFAFFGMSEAGDPARVAASTN